MRTKLVLKQEISHLMPDRYCCLTMAKKKGFFDLLETDALADKTIDKIKKTRQNATLLICSSRGIRV